MTIRQKILKDLDCVRETVDNHWYASLHATQLKLVGVLDDLVRITAQREQSAHEKYQARDAIAAATEGPS